MSGVEIGGILRGVSDRLDNGLRWMSGMVDLKLGSKPKGSGGSGGFFGGRTPLGSDPRSQLFFVVVASRHFFIKDRKLALFSEGILSFVMWLAHRAQLSKQSPFIIHLKQIFTFEASSQKGLSKGSCLLKVSFQVSPVLTLKSLSCTSCSLDYHFRLHFCAFLSWID